jgi:WD40 repeat protein
MSRFHISQFRVSNLFRVSFLGFGISAQAADKITYDDHIFPIFESKCLNCHNPDKKKGDLDLSTYTGAMAGSSGGKIALAGDGGSSKLFNVAVHTEEPVMPPEGDKIPKKDSDLIRAWIDGGLLENKGSKAKKRSKPAFSLGAVPTGKRPEGPPPMPQDLLLEPVVTPNRATVVGDMDASPWAPLLAVTGQRQILLYNTDTLELVGVLPFPAGQPETVSFHPSGKYLLAGGGIAGKSGTTITWDVTTGKVMMTMGKEFDSVLAADLRADLGGVALGGPSRLVKLWDTQEVEQTHSIKKHTDWVTALAYSHDGVLLATGGRGSGVQIWEAATGNEFHSLRGHQGAIVDIKWRADSNLVATASEDGTLRYWDMNQGKEIKKATPGGGGLLAMDYAANGKLITAGRDQRVKLWNPDLGMEKQSDPFPEMITEVAFSHDAELYFTADWSGKIEAWNSADMKKVGELSAAPPSIQDRLVSLLQEKTSFEAGLAELREKTTAAQNAVKIAREKLDQTKATIAAMKQDAIKFQNEANELEAKRKQLETQAQTKISEREKIAKEAQDPARQKSQLVEERRKLAGEQQALAQSHSSASQTLVAATRDTEKKREASNKDANNQDKKDLLVAAEQIEHQQRQIVQQLAAKIEAHKKLLADYAKRSKDLQAGVVEKDSRLKKLTDEHAQLIAQRDEVDKAGIARLEAMKAKQAKIPEVEKQLEPLQKAIQEKEKLAQIAGEELEKASGSGNNFEALVKKWKAAAINTRLIGAREELSILSAQKEEDPKAASKIAETEKRCEELLAQYQAEKPK